jgi:hypothetical protein
MPSAAILISTEQMPCTVYPNVYKWHSLAHVCPRWRHIVFASPRPLCLHFFWQAYYTSEDLTGYPAALAYHHTLLAPDYGARDRENIVAAIEHRRRVSEIGFEKPTRTILE